MKNILKTILICLTPLTVPAKDLKIEIFFRPLIQQQTLELNKKYFVDQDSIVIETLKFYIGQLGFYKGSKLIKQIENSFVLVDMAISQSLKLNTEISENNEFDNIQFTLGVDSLTNISGAMGGDLDPSKGMYWTWQSGYINFKLEGSASKCPARKNHFQFHLGGYQTPFANQQNIKIECRPKNIITIDLPIHSIVEKVNLEKNYEIMSPNTKSLELSKYISTLFTINE